MPTPPIRFPPEEWRAHVEQGIHDLIRERRPRWLRARKIEVVPLGVTDAQLREVLGESEKALSALGLEYELTVRRDMLLQDIATHLATEGETLATRSLYNYLIEERGADSRLNHEGVPGAPYDADRPRLLLTPHRWLRDEELGELARGHTKATADFAYGTLILPLGPLPGLERTIPAVVWHELGHVPGLIQEHHHTLSSGDEERYFLVGTRAGERNYHADCSMRAFLSDRSVGYCDGCRETSRTAHQAKRWTMGMGWG